MQEIDKAQDEFIESTGACYIFLRKNGLPKDRTEKLLRSSLEEVMSKVESKI